jgi:hypothetical protein
MALVPLLPRKLYDFATLWLTPLIYLLLAFFALQFSYPHTC